MWLTKLYNSVNKNKIIIKKKKIKEEIKNMLSYTN